MKIFPTKTRNFKLTDTQAKTLERLQRRTEISESLISKHTDKSFIGTIKENKFKLISSKIGKGAFCVMTGKIENNEGHVHLEIHKVFRILLSIFLCLPIIAITTAILLGKEKADPIFIIIVIAQILMIRFVFIGFAFKFLSKESLDRLRDVLDIEWTTTSLK